VLTLVVLALIAALSFGYYFFRRSSAPNELKPKNAELMKVLLNLDEEPLNELFALYKQEFGAGAARYSHETYRKWRAGEVKPNKQTFSRFFMYLPKVMSFDLKCEVLRELRDQYLEKEKYEVAVYTDNWKETLQPLVNEVIGKGETAQLPAAIQQKLNWLSDDDAQIARAILVRSQKLEIEHNLAMLDKEFSTIDQLFNNTKGKGKVTHVIKLPLGTITLHIRRRQLEKQDHG
jgi:hypothetical protein